MIEFCAVMEYYGNNKRMQVIQLLHKMTMDKGVEQCGM